MRHIKNLSQPLETLDRSAFRVFVLHEDTLTGVRATTVLGRLTDQFGVDPAIESEIWKFESLRHPELWEQASAQAIEADMIVISACGDSLLPPYVKDLFEDVLFRKVGTQIAVVALLDWERELSSQSAPLYDYLRLISETAGMDFFCNAGKWHFASCLEPVLPRIQSAIALEPALEQAARLSAYPRG